MPNDRIGNIVTVMLVVASVALVGFNIADRVSRNGSDGARTVVGGDFVLDWRTYVDGVHRRGPKDAAITIIEFADFQCPACRQGAALIDSVLARHREVAVVYRHLPLVAIHPHAIPAALASECAAEQGRFQAMHDELYRNQEEFGAKSWQAFAQEAGLPNVAAFQTCMADKRFSGRVSEDMTAARRLGAQGTPAFLINEVLIQGVPTLDRIEGVMARLRKGGAGGI